MNDFYSTQWPDLDQFMTICFHEDMDYEFPAATLQESAKKSVEDFFRTNPRKQVEQVQIELKELMNLKKSEDELAESLLAMYCRWDFSPYRPWLESVLVQFDNFLRQPPANASQDMGLPQQSNTKANLQESNGTAGNPSDDRLRRREVSWSGTQAIPDAQSSSRPRRSESSGHVSKVSNTQSSGGQVTNGRSGKASANSIQQPCVESSPQYSRTASGPSVRVVVYMLAFIFLAVCVESSSMQGFLNRIFGSAPPVSGTHVSPVNQTQSPGSQPNWQMPREYQISLTIDKEIERAERTIGNATVLVGLQNLNNYALVSFNRPHDLVWIWCPDGYRLKGATTSTGNQIVHDADWRIGLVNDPPRLSRVTFACTAISGANH